jgi:ketosteroid isomerase-like protein
MNNDIAVFNELEEQRYLAMRQGDLQAFEDLSHPQLSYVHSNDHRVHDVRISGDTVLVFGEMSADITSHGIAKTLHNRTLTVWIKTGLQWRFFAYQPTPMAKPSAL